MLKSLPVRVFRLLPWLGLLFLTGCGGQKAVTVSGKLVLPNTVKLADTDAVSINFLAQDKDVNNALAVFSKNDNSFECKGTVSKAKYKITVRIEPYSGQPDSEKRAAALEGTNKNFDRDVTKLTYETTQDASQSITIDLNAGTVTKN